MNRKWMYLEDRLCKEYIDGVKRFIEVAGRDITIMEMARCPCRECKN